MQYLLQNKIQLIIIIGVLIFSTIILRLIYKGKLRTEYSFVWIFVSVVFTVFSVWRSGIDLIAHALNVYYAPALIFMFFFFVIFVFLIHLSVVNSKQHEQIKTLAQEMALLKNDFENLKKQA